MLSAIIASAAPNRYGRQSLFRSAANLAGGGVPALSAVISSDGATSSSSRTCVGMPQAEHISDGSPVVFRSFPVRGSGRSGQPPQLLCHYKLFRKSLAMPRGPAHVGQLPSPAWPSLAGVTGVITARGGLTPTWQAPPRPRAPDPPVITARSVAHPAKIHSRVALSVVFADFAAAQWITQPRGGLASASPPPSSRPVRVPPRALLRITRAAPSPAPRRPPDPGAPAPPPPGAAPGPVCSRASLAPLRRQPHIARLP